jgi:glycosyltransferase involved in cell wall biosynthesis
MKILIIGDWPGFFGGVTNYTRPLAEELAKENEVFYLYSCTRTENYDFGPMRFKPQNPINNSKVNYFELINPPTRYVNYSKLFLDTDKWLNKLFIEFINKYKPEVIHIHEIFGFTSQIIEVAKKKNIKVIVTVHEYWWLCPHRVMVDYNKKICDGPSDINKCSNCVNKINFKPQSKLKIIVRKKIKFIHKFYLKFLKSKIKPEVNSINLEYENNIEKDLSKTSLSKELKNRLKENIKYLNSTDLIIGVSTNVKEILTQYGVNHNKIIVNHIGSLIANNKIEHYKKIHPNNLIFGFIGGVGYYKGVHQMVEAYLMLPLEYQNKSKLFIYGKADDLYKKSIEEMIHKHDSIYKSSISFFGSFKPDDLTNITNTIDISILPSLCADTAPQTIFESFNAGLPIIAPSIGGFPDFISNEVNGLLYEKASICDLMNKIKQIIDKPELIEKFRTNIIKTKTLEENTRELMKIYKNEFIF